ncbi:DUF354 domain-containing protein [Methanoculleus sp. FWC-SCC1]|uniref:DUF354 domain-containing protein n=1 Tax=Methanoculleus frigidifontis TaxID=2584085 RepID=A0ABT8MCJ7_9EURY|nr:DUF354 domain-containing protein [Methanoculleus sp. FWC-SCC1]MDN7025665.1 DUF354 domain-containing protein [Methanoculleus sp. FWC-SCC1]
MRLIFDIGHPAQVHFHKNTIKKLQEHGHDVLVSARDKDVLLELLSHYNIEYRVISKQKIGFTGLSIELFQRIRNLSELIRAFKPDLICGPGETVALAGKLTSTPVILFNDSEPVPINKILTYPFVDIICTPSTFRNDLGQKQIRYEGYKELAYLHPNYFIPDPSILKELQIDEKDPYTIVHFVAWNAQHDAGHKGLGNKEEIVKELEKYSNVLISSEAALPKPLRKYQISIPPEKMHDALYYAKILLCDSQTMTTEAAVLGTPAIRCNSFVGSNDMGNFIELEQKYGLIYNYSDEHIALSKATELLQQPKIKEAWVQKRDNLLKDKIDVTAFLVWLIENYPQSSAEIKEHPGVQYSCTHAPDDES